jgi:predicted esterase
MDPKRAQELWTGVFRLFELRHQGKDAEALGLALRMRDQFPEQPAEINYFVAIFYAWTGQSAMTFETFESALDEGMAWNEDLLRRSPSLQSLQEHPRFKQMVTRSEARMQALQARTAVELVIAAPAHAGPTTPLLMPFHGGADTLEEFAPQWQAATSAGMIVCVPQSSQRRSTDTFWWGPGDSFDQERSEADIQFAYEKLRRDHGFGRGRVVLGGYSQGAVMGVTLALQQRPFPSIGFICVGPGTSNLEPLLPLMQPAAARGLRGWILGGEREPSLEHVERLHRELILHGLACQLDVVPALGHEFPDDFPTRLASAIHFVLG